MERKTLAKWLVSTALVCFGLFLGAGVASAQEGNVVQGQNGSTDSRATSDTATARNDMTFQAGPAAGGVGAPASAAQIGDNAGSHSQNATAQSGDAAAGSTVAGVVGNGATIQTQNSSDGARARSGVARAVNTTGPGGIQLGPQANAGGATANASQIGDNRLDTVQAVAAHTGDAVAGSQVTGVVGDGDNTVQAQNNADDPIARSGDVDLSNSVELRLGPEADAGNSTAQASQIGDNDATLSQSNLGESGDAVAGSQVAGVVGDGESTTQGQLSSDDARAASGDVFADNVAVLQLGAFARTAGTGSGTAQAAQNGDNSADIDQRLESSSGDAVAGSQVTGLVSEEAGHITVQNQQASEDDTAVSGDVGTFANPVENTITARVGATALRGGFGSGGATVSQIGDNDLTVAQHATSRTGDAVAGAQVTGVVAGSEVTIQNQNSSEDSIARSGLVEDSENEITIDAVGPLAQRTGFGSGQASATQNGDNSVAIEQVLENTTGDAVAGAQVTGVVTDGGDVTVQNQNSSDDARAVSGDADNNDNDVEIIAVGATARRFGLGSGDATASQIGDNDVAVFQHNHATTGDAVAGSQVTGIVADDAEVTVQNQNTSRDDTATSGDAEFSDNDFLIDVVGPYARRAGIGSGGASATQNGDNALAAEQGIDVATGDAVAGSQVTGVVASSEVTVQNQNDSRNSVAVTGDAGVDDNDIDDVFAVGPLASRAGAGSGGALASQIGENAADFTQSAEATSGDAVAGGQVTGVVANDAEVTVQNQNTSRGARATSGDVEDAENDIDVEVIGPRAGRMGAGSGGAQASQNGDNVVTVEQSLDAHTGDAVAGAQVTGIVASDAEVTVQNQNTSRGATARTGDNDDNENLVQIDAVGPRASRDGIGSGSAIASQIGDNDVDVAQDNDSWTGDAVAGSQVTGVVASGGEVTIQNQNTAVDPLAVSGDAENSDNELVIGAVGPYADRDGTGSGGALASQNGDNEVAIAQVIEVSSGDAVAGSQVTGVVVKGGDVTIQLQNASRDAVARTGDAEVDDNDIVIRAVGPWANRTALAGGADSAAAAQMGDNTLHLVQVGIAASGDAVAGSQVVGVVEDDTAVQLQNRDDGSVALSSDADVENDASGNVGPVATAIFDSADAQQNGDSGVSAEQRGEALTGDVLAGGQVVGLVGFGAASLSTGSGLAPSAGTTGDSSFEIASAAAA